MIKKETKIDRVDGRTPNQLRPITFETGFTKWAEGSVLAHFGNTHVLCNVTIEENLPAWLRNREERRLKGRTQEIGTRVSRIQRIGTDL